MSKQSIDPDNPTLPELIPVDEALQRLLSKAPTITDIDQVPIIEACGRVLAEDIRSTISVPPAANSSMDGYAINSADCLGNGPHPLPVSQRIAAGQTGTPLEAGTAARIFTGAPIPPGADAVVMQEQTERTEDVITINAAIKPLQNIRATGEDVKIGDTVLSQGRRLSPQDIGILASVGITKIPVFRRLRVGIFFTGDELREPNQPLQAGQIYNSNRYTLRALLQNLGCELLDLGITEDSLAATSSAMQQAAEADLVITSGGVSVGEEDYVRIALQQLGTLDMWRIKIKPGKPLAFGRIGTTPFLGMPGNPVSVFATFCIMARPFILCMQGNANTTVPTYPVIADFDWSGDSRLEYIRVRLVHEDNDQPHLQLFSNQKLRRIDLHLMGDWICHRRAACQHPARRSHSLSAVQLGFCELDSCSAQSSQRVNGRLLP